MAVYLYDEFSAANPKSQLSILNKFIPSEKNLHEMSVSEINAILAEGSAYTDSTIRNNRTILNSYYKFLSAHGVNVDTKITSQFAFPYKDSQYLIFSTDDLLRCWEVVFESMERQAKKLNKRFFREAFYKEVAVTILAFYGFTVEQINALSKSDVTENGIKGYNIPMKQTDIEALVRYRDLKIQPGNNSPLLGDSFIRSTKTQSAKEKGVDPSPRPSSSLRLKEMIEDEYLYLSSKLTYSNVFKLGLYDRIYKYESENNLRMDATRKMPQWFLDMAGVVSNGGKTEVKRSYVAYRTERQAANSIKKVTKLCNPQTEETTPDIFSTSRVAFDEKVINNLDREVKTILSEMKQLQNRLEIINNIIESLKY